jgi:hypothetical protein
LKNKKDNRSRCDGARAKHQKKEKHGRGLRKTHLEYGILATKGFGFKTDHQITTPKYGGEGGRPRSRRQDIGSPAISGWEGVQPHAE